MAFFTMSVVTTLLGAFATSSIVRDGNLVDQTYDRSLMAVSYSRAASADFFALLAASARGSRLKGQIQAAKIENQLEVLRQTMADDLSVAVERAQSQRASEAADRVNTALASWFKARAAFALNDDAATWRELDRLADNVIVDLDLLINYTAGDGFTYRQSARATIHRSREYSMLATAAALLLSGLIAWLLARHITGPIRKAAHVAGQISRGDLDVAIPDRRSDELGTLLSAMEQMRRAIKLSMSREIAMRESAQMQLANALEYSADGVVVTDAKHRIVLANAQASDLLGSFASIIEVGGDAEPLFEKLDLRAENDTGVVREVEREDGCWLRISQNQTRDGGAIVIASDISLIKLQQHALNTTNFWLDAALSNLSHGLCLFGADGRLKVYNQRFCSLFSLGPDCAAAGMTLDEILACCFPGRSRLERETYEGQLRGYVRALIPVERLLPFPDERQVAMALRPLKGGGWLATFEDVTERLEAEQKIAFMARHDALTGLPNRLFFAERVAHAFSATKRGEHFALLYLDLDHFKQVNDTLGHPTGDDLLREVAKRIGPCLRDVDTFARLGGDEFAIIQTAISSANDAARLADRVLASLADPFRLGANKISISASIGVSLAPQDGKTYDKLLKNSDLALYQAKADGRNATRFFQPGMDEALQARRSLEIDLREAVTRGDLQVHYQPIFNMAEKTLCGVEALVRWFHPLRGPISPADFIPISEEIGLVNKIGDLVLATACTDAMKWPCELAVAVNVSAAQFRSGDFVNKVIQVLFDTGLPPSRLELEITETALLEDNRSTLIALQRLRELGVKIALDDFGTGYSSLSYLRSFPFDRLKIDQSFTRDASAGSRAIIRAIIALCSSLQMRTTGEGVETAEQFDALLNEGCDEVQGFLLSQPMPKERITALLDNKAAPRLIDQRSVQIARLVS